MKNPAVYLIGAGPGDPGLITVHGLECLRRADVVIHDHLVPTRLLKHARQGAELIDVGSSARQPMAQDAISFLLAEKAREGKLVARLKWGDPFVFDRGGEEALFLHEHGIPFEVVPGIPLGIGVPAYAGVPVTYPGGGDTITLVRGYEDDNRVLPDIDWSSLARLEGTVVCYAGAQQLPRLFDALIAGGWPADGQAVIVYNGTLTSQDTVTGTIEELASRAHDSRAAIRPSSSSVASSASAITCAGSTRARCSASACSSRAREIRPQNWSTDCRCMGAEAIEAPMIRIAPPEDPDPLLRAADDANAFDWIVFTSANAVEAFMPALLDGTRDVRSLKRPRLCCVGTGTAERLARYGIKVDLIPDEFRAEALVMALADTGSLEGQRVLLPRADIGREVIAEGLRDGGRSSPTSLPTERCSKTRSRTTARTSTGCCSTMRSTWSRSPAPRRCATSPRSTARSRRSTCSRDTVVAAIGPVTAEAAHQLGIEVTVQPTVSTIPALVDAIAAARLRRGDNQVGVVTQSPYGNDH